VALPGTGRNSFSDVGEDLAIAMTGRLRTPLRRTGFYRVLTLIAGR
jgi:hypothetical protein